VPAQGEDRKYATPRGGIRGRPIGGGQGPAASAVGALGDRVAEAGQGGVGGGNRVLLNARDLRPGGEPGRALGVCRRAAVLAATPGSRICACAERNVDTRGGMPPRPRSRSPAGGPSSRPTGHRRMPLGTAARTAADLGRMT